MSRPTSIAASADGSGTYHCAWAITSRSTAAHLVASADFPIAGRRYRSWCGEPITVIALTLDARRLPRSCTECNRQLRMLALADGGSTPAEATPTREELDARYHAATAYLREHLCPTLTDADLAAGERFWREVKAGRLPTSLGGSPGE